MTLLSLILMIIVVALIAKIAYNRWRKVEIEERKEYLKLVDKEYDSLKEFKKTHGKNLKKKEKELKQFTDKE